MQIVKILSDQEIVEEARYRANVDRFLTENADGTITFLHKTRSFVL